MKQRRALILYATMTRNTEKIAVWFKETFEHYNWDVTLFRLAVNADWAGMRDKLYFDDYDIVCLGSPIVAGSPLKIVSRVLALGGEVGGAGIEHAVQQQVNSGKTGYNMDDKPPMPPAGPKPGEKFIMTESCWRRNPIPYMGFIDKNEYRPLGIVFTTYGGGFYGSREAKPTLELLRLYLETHSVDVKGFFACAGKETGPAGLGPGQKPHPLPNADGTPRPELADPMVYTTKEGDELVSSYFHHFQGWTKPGPRDEAKAKALIGDMVEDYFLTNDGERRLVLSDYVSLS